MKLLKIKMSYLQIKNVSKCFGENILFNDISLSINEGDKVALIGRNGSGKSTLFKMIMGLSDPDSGELILSKHLKIAFLSQESNLDPNLTISESIFQTDNEIVKAVKAYNQAFENPDQNLIIHEAMEKMDELNAWNFEHKVKEILAKLKIDHLSAKIALLSGGEKKRLALAQMLIAEPVFLILDEPTNHLDVAMIEWIEEYFKQSNITLFMVSHDRYFIDRVCNKIIELDEGKIYEHRGNYSYFLEKKAERLENKNKEIAKAKNLYRKELDWMNRMPKARGTKSKARIDDFHEIAKIAHQKILEKNVELDLREQRMGAKILEFYNLNKKHGTKDILKNFSYKFRHQDRLGIIGANGVGKSTFLDIITGIHEPDSGKIIKGDTVKIGYYSQIGMKLNEDKRVIEVVKEVAEFIPLSNGKKISAGKLLERFLFNEESQYNFVSKLSGGEKRRLNLLRILMDNPNFLILDEPTNDLDIVTLNILEDFLEQFQGCLVIVSHDRFFMDRLTHHLFVFKGEGLIEDFIGNYSEYRQNKENEKDDFKMIKEEKEEILNNKKNKLTGAERNEIKKLEKEIAILEKKKNQLTEKLGSVNYLEALKISQEIESIIKEIDGKTERWIWLGDKR